MGVTTSAHPCIQALALPLPKDKQRSQPTPEDYIYPSQALLCNKVSRNIIYPRRRLLLLLSPVGSSNLRDLNAQNDNVRKRLF